MMAGGRAGAADVDPRAVAAWLAVSCARSGVPVKVTDPSALRTIGVLLGADPGGRPRRAKRAAGPRVALQLPDGLGSGRVEAGAASGLGGVDDDVVYDGYDDGGLPDEVEAGPAGA